MQRTRSSTPGRGARGLPFRLRSVPAGAAGLALGAAIGAAVLLGPAGRATGDANDQPNVDPARMIDATHVPALLTVAGEPVTLRYDIYCPPPDGSASDACDAAGTVYVRAGDAGAFRPLPLALDRTAAEGRYAAQIPKAIAGSRSGFSYYAVVRNRATGASLTLPGGGSAAPQRSYPLERAIDVELGSHVFGGVRRPTQRVLTAPWGDRPADAGLEGGPERQPVGPGAFAVSADGTVTVLDQVHRRALELRPGTTKPTALPLPVNGTLADLDVDGTGGLWVLETAGPGAPLVRGFGPGGRLQRIVPLADRTATQVRTGPEGPVVKQYPSEEWTPVLGAGTALDERAQRAAAEPVRPVSGGRDIAVLRTADEVRVALVGPTGVERAWRVHSATPLAEVQLAEPYGDGVLLVVRTYTDGRDEFVVARLGPAGLVASFSLDSADWAETAPLSRFRLAGSSLYQLGSSPAAVRVDRFDLEVSS
jgi:hypothetical protein